MAEGEKRWLRLGVLITVVVAMIVLAGGLSLRKPGETGVRAPFASSLAQHTGPGAALALASLQAPQPGQPDEYLAQLRAGQLSYAGGQHLIAVAHYQRAIALAPDALEPRLGLLLPLMALGRWDRAAQVVSPVLERAPGNYLAESRMAYIEFSRGRHEQAQWRYRALVNRYPGDHEMLLGLAWTYQRQGLEQEARETFERVLAIRPQHPGAREGLASLGSAPAVAASGIAASGVAAAGVAASGVAASGVAASGVAASGVAASGVAASGVAASPEVASP